MMKLVFHRFEGGIARLTALLPLLPAILLLTGCLKERDCHGSGFLAGTVTVGPLCPVEHNPPDSACLPTAATYLAYPVGVWTADGKNRISTITPDPPAGTYLLSLAPGTYRVVFEQSPEGPSRSNLPAEVAITDGDTTWLDIDIDTGIRRP
jgi:hypothetical protein